MAFSSYRVSVGTQPTRLDRRTDRNVAASSLISNRGSVPIYIGGPDVTVATGFQVDPGQSPSADYSYGDALWAVTDSGTARVDVLQQGG